MVLPTKSVPPKRVQRSGVKAQQPDAPASLISPQHVAIMRQQQLLGNSAVTRSLQRRGSAANPPARAGEMVVASSPAEIAKHARAAEHDPGVRVAYAGVPVKQDPPAGMTFIAAQSGDLGLGGKPAGFTGVKSAAAFTQPNFTTQMVAEKDGYKRRYYAEVQPTSTSDVTHRSYYPAPGIHDNAVSKQKDATYHYYWKISETISDLIRAGEQEHLNDAQRAFDLTYGLIAKEINAMAGQRFGPAETPDAATKLAEDALRSRLPAALGVDPRNWFTVLEAMLSMTLNRDRTHLHDVIPGEAIKRGTSFYIPLETTAQTSIDQVGSEQIVNYPSATASASGSGGSRTPAEPEGDGHNHGK
jgi:hypothetical protein